MTRYFIKERTPGNAFTTFTNPAGEQVRVPTGPRTIGPFGSIPQAADYLATKAIPNASYLIESEVEPAE